MTATEAVQANARLIAACQEETIVKFQFSLVILLLLACGAVASASDWVDRISEVVPGNVKLTEVEETADYVRLRGQARNNADIAVLMRAIEAADLGSVELQQITRSGEVSEFLLRVKARR